MYPAGRYQVVILLICKYQIDMEMSSRMTVVVPRAGMYKLVLEICRL